jgi:hypothetical protein
MRAATIAYFLAREDPDMYRLMQLPSDGLVIPHQVIPIKWVSFVSSVHSVFPDFIQWSTTSLQLPLLDHLYVVVASPPRRRHVKRPPGYRASGPAIAMVYLCKRRR